MSLSESSSLDESSSGVRFVKPKKRTKKPAKQKPDAAVTAAAIIAFIKKHSQSSEKQIKTKPLQYFKQHVKKIVDNECNKLKRHSARRFFVMRLKEMVSEKTIKQRVYFKTPYATAKFIACVEAVVNKDLLNVDGKLLELSDNVNNLIVADDITKNQIFSCANKLRGLVLFLTKLDNEHGLNLKISFKLEQVGKQYKWKNDFLDELAESVSDFSVIIASTKDVSSIKQSVLITFSKIIKALNILSPQVRNFKFEKKYYDDYYTLRSLDPKAHDLKNNSMQKSLKQLVKDTNKTVTNMTKKLKAKQKKTRAHTL